MKRLIPFAAFSLCVLAPALAEAAPPTWEEGAYVYAGPGGANGSMLRLVAWDWKPGSISPSWAVGE